MSLAWPNVFHGRQGMAQESQPAGQTQPSLNRRVRQLVRRLGLGSNNDRNQAERELIQLGPDALPYIPPPDRDMPAELKVRLQRVLAALERQAAESVWNATRFRLSGKRTIAQWLKEIERQTGNRFVAEELPTGPVEVQMEETDFWPGIDRLLDQWRLDIDVFGSEPGALSITRRLPTRLSRRNKTAYNGPIRVEAARVFLSRDLRQTAAPTARLEIEVAWEPRMKPIAIRFPLLDFFAVDENRKTVYESSSPDAVPTYPVRPGMCAVTLAVPFPAPPRTTKKWSRVGGVCELLIPGELAEFRFDDLTKAATKKVAAAEVAYQGIRQNGDIWEVRLKLQYDEAFTGLDSHRGWVEDNPVYLIAPDGRKLEPLGLELTSQSRHSVGFAFLFDLTLDPSRYRLYYATPAKIMQREVSFDLTEIDLP